MTFDPSVLSNIGDSGPDITGSQAKGFQLKDMVDKNQLNKLYLSGAKREEEKQSTLADLYKKGDISSQEGVTKLASQVGKVDPQAGMGLMKLGQQVTEGDIDILQKKLETQKNVVSFAADYFTPIWQSATQMRQQGKTDGEINDFVNSHAHALVVQSQNNPDLPDQVKKQIAQNVAQGKKITFDQLTQIVNSSQTHLQQVNAALDQLNKITGIKKNEAETDKARADITQGQERVDISRQNAAAFSGDDGELLAALADRGVSLPAGLRSKQQILATLHGLRAAHPGQSFNEIADGLASGKIKFGAETTAGRVAGGQIGKVALAANELDNFGDQTLAASKGLPRGISITFNGLMQMGEAQISNPKLLTLRLKLQALNNAYDQLSARGGTDTEKRAHIHELFDQRISDEAIQTLVTGLKQEAAGARQAANRTVGEVSGTAIPGVAGGSPPAAATPPQAAPANQNDPLGIR